MSWEPKLLLEIGANVFNLVCIFLAGLNNVHTWWTGIVGCGLFAASFLLAQLYADVTLQGFFIVTGILGWIRWRKGEQGQELPVRRVALRAIPWLLAAGLAVTFGYGWILHRFTSAYAPFWDSLVLAFSVLGQLLLLDRRYESWWCWLVVNTVSVPLYFSRELHLTALCYAGFWVNAIVALVRWRRLIVRA